MYKLVPILLFAYCLAIKTEDIYDNSYALIIGINNYQNAKKLDYAVKDAESIYNTLIHNYGFDKNNIKLLLDIQATYYNIRKELFTIIKSAGINDRVLIYFAGHGETMTLPDGGEMGYLIPWEGEKNDLYMTSIAMSELKQLALMSKAKHILYLVDACYSGLAITNFRSMKQQSSTSNYIYKITKNKARQIITAGGKDEPVIEKPEWGHSVFTKNILSGLSNRNADINLDNIITANELGMYLSDRVTIDAEFQQTPQYGRMTADEGEFVFIGKNKILKTEEDEKYEILLKENIYLKARLMILESKQVEIIN